MTAEEREQYFTENGCYPIEDKDIPDNEKTIITAEQIAAGEPIRRKMAAIQYLKNTDWYAARKAEAGTAIPADILALRQQARADASS